MTDERAVAAANEAGTRLEALYEFTNALGSAQNIDQALEILLLTAMGITRTRSSAVLLHEHDDLYRVAVSRGAGDSFCKGGVARLPAKLVKYPYFYGDRPELKESGLDGLACSLCVPLHRMGKVLGLICLGARSPDTPYEDHQVQFIQSMANLASMLLENSLFIKSLEQMQRRLQLKVFQLDSLFDVTSGFNIMTEEQEILRILVSTLMGQLGVGRCAVLLPAKEYVETSFHRGFKADPHDLAYLNSRELTALGVDESCSLDALTKRIDRDFLSILEKWEMHHLFPIKLNDRPKGMILLGRLQAGRPLDAEDASFIQTVGEQALVCLDNRRLHLEMLDKEKLHRELAIAAEIQHRLLPEGPPCLSGYEIAAKAQPCREVGGDYHDFLTTKHLPDVGLAIADVSGKSVPASLLMAFAGATVRALFNAGQTLPVALTTTLNHVLSENSSENRFMSFFYGVLAPGTGRLNYVNAGHNPPFVVRAGGGIETLKSGGVVLGLFPDAEFREGELTLAPGDMLVLYTDGMTEVFDDGDDEFGEERLIDAVRSRGEKPVQVILEETYAALASFGKGKPLTDDATMIVLKRLHR